MLRGFYGAINLIFPSSNAKCFKGKGKITYLCENYGIVDDKLFFNIEVAYKGTLALAKGMTVSYLGYRQPSSQTPMIAKIFHTPENPTKVVKKSNPEKIKSDNNEIARTDSEVTDIHFCSLIGKVVHNDINVINFKTKYCDITVNVEDFKLDFIPSNGDLFYLNCKIDQTDNCFKILNVVNIDTVDAKTVKSKITKLDKNWGVIEHTYFFLKCQFTNDYTPQVGDEVKAKVIQSKKKLYDWRCIEVTKEKN